MRFKDRADAARQLVEPLRAHCQGPVVIAALARGGVALGNVLAEELDAELAVLLVRKIGAPGNPELALGAVCDGAEPQQFINRALVEALGVDEVSLARAVRQQFAEIERRKQLYRGRMSEPDFDGKTVVITDDGVATGATMRVAIESVRARGAGRIVLAVPVASAEALETLAPHVDAIVCLSRPVFFHAVGAHYEDFQQVDDEQVIALLRSKSARLKQ
jgi:putative phosphoribosyl transferase